MKRRGKEKGENPEGGLFRWVRAYFIAAAVSFYINCHELIKKKKKGIANFAKLYLANEFRSLPKTESQD